MKLSQNIFPILSRALSRQIRGRNWVAVCLCVIVRAGCGHVSWFILGNVLLLLGKTWIWPKVSN